MKKGHNRIKKQPTNNEKLLPIIVLAGFITLELWLIVFGQGNIGQAPTQEPLDIRKPTIIYKEAEQNLTEKQEIMQYIILTFGENAMDALKIAECESGLNPKREGDGHLTSIDQQYNEVVGDSIGVFQIRNGGEGWNRARANGKSAERFRQDLKDWKYNIDYAKSIFDRAGDWHDWYNCSVKTGLI